MGTQGRTVFTNSLGIGLDIASGTVVARAIGAGDTASVGHSTATSLFYGGVFGSVFAGLVWFNIPFLVALLGASGETLDLATTYLNIIVPTAPLLVMGMIASAILRAHGDGRRAMYATLTVGAVNAVLDPILIFGLNLELVGAAWASVSARLAMVLVAIYPIIRHYGGLNWPGRVHLKADFKILFALAIPAILTQLATPIGQAFVTRTMAEFGEAAVAGMAIIGRITPVAFGTVFALSGAIGPIIGQNFGAQQYDRVRRAFIDGLIFLALFVSGMALLLFLLRP
ncbi:MAG: MATE family efflux transporter, partial [Planktomarina sp.]